MRKKFTTLCVIIAVLSLVLLATRREQPVAVVEAGSGDIIGRTPEYDSGWVNCAGNEQVQTFVHNLSGWPLEITVVVKNDTLRTHPAVLAATWTYYHEVEAFYGYLPYGPTDSQGWNKFRIKWWEHLARDDGGGWIPSDHWDTEVRLFIWSYMEM